MLLLFYEKEFIINKVSLYVTIKKLNYPLIYHNLSSKS